MRRRLTASATTRTGGFTSTTSSRRPRWARPVAWERPVAGRWATGTSRRGRSCRSSPRTTISPLHREAGVHNHGEQRELVDGDGVRRVARAARRGGANHTVRVVPASRSTWPPFSSSSLSTRRSLFLSFARVASKRPSPVLKNAFRLARLGGYGKRSSHNRAIFTRHLVELSTGTPPGSVACEIGALGRDVRVAVNRCPLSRDVRRFSRFWILFPL